MKKKIFAALIIMFVSICSITNTYAASIKVLVRGVNYDKASDYPNSDLWVGYIEGTGTSSPPSYAQLTHEDFIEEVINNNIYQIATVESLEDITEDREIGTNNIPLDSESTVKIGNVTYYVVQKYNASTKKTEVPTLNELKKFATVSDDFWGAASSWWGDASQNSASLPVQANDVIYTLTNMINVVGTTVIVAATIILGIKYMLGSVEAQTSAKEGLINLLVACVFFFGWTAISNLLFPNNNFIFVNSSDTSYTNMVGRIFGTFTYVAQFLVVGIIIYVGIKYIFAGASGKADLKGKSVYFIIGIILVFATTNVLDFISRVINEAI